MTPQEQATGYLANYTSTALVILINCLKNNGALRPTQYEDALRETINAPGAARDRLDYKHLALLLQMLEGNVPKAH